MNKQLRTIASQSGIDIYGLGKDRVKWEHCVEQFADLLEKDIKAKHYSAGYTQGRSDGTIETVQGCKDAVENTDPTTSQRAIEAINRKFGI